MWVSSLKPVPMSRCLMAWTFVAALLARGALAATSCGSNPPLPFAVPIRDTQIEPSIPDSFMRGIPASIGTPSQNIVLLPWPELNNTYIYDDQLSCSEGRFANDEANCRVRRGGLFRESMSTSFNKSSDLMAAGGATQEIGTRGSEPGIPKLLSNSLAGAEWFALSGSNATSFPTGIPRIEWDTGFTTMHALGLGSNSTYLNALVAANQIPSRVWSFFWGRTWTRNTDMDGSVVLGGYDEQKVFLDNLTQPLDYYGENGCWTGMMVTVADIKVNFRDGNERSVMPQNVKVSSCIVPQRQLVWEGPPDIISEFQRVTGIEDGGTVNGFHANARAINASDVSSVFDGDVTFVLSSPHGKRLEVTVPNNQFIVPRVDIQSNGFRTIDWSKRDMLLSRLNGNEPSTLGRYFFTSAYLMVDHDAHTFTLWKASPSNKSNLVPVVSKSTGSNGCETEGDGNNGVGNSGGGEKNGPGDRSSGGGENAPSSSSSSSSSSSVSTGAIAGGVVGGVAALAIITLVFFMRRKRQRQRLAPTTDGGHAPSSQFATSDYSEPNEVPGSQVAVELRADEDDRPQELYGDTCRV